MLSLIRMLREWAWEPPEAAVDCSLSPDAVPATPYASEWAEVWQQGSLGIPRGAKAQWLVRHGVPPLMRAEVWRRCADSLNYPEPTMEAQLDYSTLLGRAQEQGACDVGVLKQIEKDLHRTFGSVQGVRVPQQEALTSLRNVLVAYAVHNPQVGYCQSMNFIVAVLLLIVDEESAFWCLTAVVERLLPGHFTSRMVMSLVDQGVLRNLLRKQDPELMAHFEHLQVATSLVTTQWLLTLFVGSAMPLSALLRLWDCVFYEGDASFLFRAAAALLLRQRDALLASVDMCDAYRVLMGLGSSLDDIDALLDAAYALPWHASLQPKPLAALRRAAAGELAHECDGRAAEEAAAAVAVVEATTTEGRAEPRGRAAIAALGTSPWTMVSAPFLEADADEPWDLVEQSTPKPSARTSLSYVILQLEAPRLVEEYFMIDVPRTSKRGRARRSSADGEMMPFVLEGVCDEPASTDSDASDSPPSPRQDPYRGGFVSTVASRLDALLERFS